MVFASAMRMINDDDEFSMKFNVASPILRVHIVPISFLKIGRTIISGGTWLYKQLWMIGTHNSLHYQLPHTHSQFINVGGMLEGFSSYFRTLTLHLFFFYLPIKFLACGKWQNSEML